MSTKYKLATEIDIDRLLDLYLRILCKSGFVSACDEKNREHYRGELRNGLISDEVWFLEDAQGPITLGHFDPKRDEIVAIGTRTDMERKGHGSSMLSWLADRYPAARTIPTTRGGKAIAKKIGFLQLSQSESQWTRTAGIGNKRAED